MGSDGTEKDTQWGAAVYPATLFTTAPFEQLQAVLARFPVGS